MESSGMHRILGRCSYLAILPPALLSLGIIAYTAGQHDRSHTARESLDWHTGQGVGSCAACGSPVDVGVRPPYAW